MDRDQEAERGLDAEMGELFGEVTVRVARMLDPAALWLTADLMDRVHDAADAILMRATDPESQRRYVAALPSDTRCILCMWIMDTELGEKLTTRATLRG